MNNSRKTKAAKIAQPQQQQSKAKRSRKRSRANTPYRSMGVYPEIQAPGVSSGAIQKQRLKSASNILRSARVSAAGMAFLKCAFAPPDFDSVKIQGVPDHFEGNSLVKKHRLVNSETFAANLDVYYILAPVPGVAYFKTAVAPGAGVAANTVFTAVHYADAFAMFGAAAGNQAANIVTKFRHVSNHIELVPTTNQMTWTGSIQSWKMPLSLEIRNTTDAGDLYSIVGLQGCTSTNSNQYTGPFNLGVYTACYNKDAQFNFSSIIERIALLPTNLATAGTFGQLASDGITCLPGLDNGFDSLVVKVSGIGANNSNTCIIKTWTCVEYQVLPGSNLYEYQTFSPCDPMAILLYRKVINELPVGVAFTDNESFWRRVLQIIKTMSGNMSVLPGPYGMAAAGVHTLSTAIEELAL